MGGGWWVVGGGWWVVGDESPPGRASGRPAARSPSPESTATGLIRRGKWATSDVGNRYEVFRGWWVVGGGWWVMGVG